MLKNRNEKFDYRVTTSKRESRYVYLHAFAHFCQLPKSVSLILLSRKKKDTVRSKTLFTPRKKTSKFQTVVASPSNRVNSLPRILTLPTPSKLLRPCAYLAPSCALLPRAIGKGPSPVHEGGTQALHHSGGPCHPSDFDGSPLPIAMSRCKTNNSTSQERDAKPPFPNTFFTPNSPVTVK